MEIILKNARDVKDEDTGDDVTEGKDTHQLVEIVPLVPEPEYDEDVPNGSQNTNADLNMIDIVKDLQQYILSGLELTQLSRLDIENDIRHDNGQ